MTAHGDVWRPSASLRIAAIGAIVLAGGGIATARPDLIALAVPLALWAILQRPRSTDPIEPLTIAVRSQAAQQQGRLREEIVVSGAGEIAELSITQAERRKTRVVVPVSSTILADSRPGHSGPVEAVRVIGRSAAGDGARIAGETVPVTARRTVTPAMRMLPRLPLAPRLTGLHGAHEGSRPGQGGDFRDIHPFAPGDELRRVDWRATARAARRPGELLVRRTHTLSDASVVLAVDTAEDLGEVVATWGGDDLSRAGTTSLDLAREAARSLAAAAIAVGDRVAYHALAPGGRSVRGATGSRHLARLTTAIAATGAAGDDRQPQPAHPPRRRRRGGLQHDPPGGLGHRVRGHRRADVRADQCAPRSAGGRAVRRRRARRGCVRYLAAPCPGGRGAVSRPGGCDAPARRDARHRGPRRGAARADDSRGTAGRRRPSISRARRLSRLRVRSGAAGHP